MAQIEEQPPTASAGYRPPSREVPASMVATGYSPTSGISMRNDGNGKAVFVITSDVKSLNLRIPLR
ncbi:MAG: hypothetical protein K8H99_09405 [Nitrospirae bacterium]|nr:hypothetical protein [Fimbriimonadaceae bacterium]